MCLRLVSLVYQITKEDTQKDVLVILIHSEIIVTSTRTFREQMNAYSK